MKWPKLPPRDDLPADTWIELYLSWITAMVTIVAIAIVVALFLR